jgi:HAD superfamily hydrolase (TIGR01450 family)
VTALVDPYDLVILDLDGVVVLGDRPVEGATAAIARLRATGKKVRFVTNNASRTAAQVAQLLTRVGVPADPSEVLTSAGATAALLAQRFAPGSPILVVGAPALRADVEAAGLAAVSNADSAPVAVIQGYGPNVGWADLAEACVAVRAGALWAATNTDRTLPTPRGALPGNGALVAALATALERQPDLVVGKPQPGLFLAAAKDAGATGTLVVGDRLDTDIAGAHHAGMDSLLVLTGVATAAEAAAAGPEQVPTYVATDLAGLFAVA